MVLGSVVITTIRMFNYIIHQRITNGRVTEDSVAVLKKKKNRQNKQKILFSCPNINTVYSHKHVLYLRLKT